MRQGRGPTSASSAGAAFHAKLTETIAREAPGWALAPIEGAPGSWSARREADEEVMLRAVHWRAPGGVVDGLPDTQNIERLVCAVAARAYPAEATIVERWLNEIGGARGRAPKWKAVLHLWCALADEASSETNAAARFLHDNRALRAHVQPLVDEVGLLADLRPLLGPP